MSSVSGLKESPSSATVLPDGPPPRADTTFSTDRCFIRSLTSMTVSTISNGRPALRAMSASAWVSLGKQEPP